MGGQIWRLSVPYTKTEEALVPQKYTEPGTIGLYNYTKVHANPLDGYGGIESKMCSYTFVLVAVTSFTHCYLSALKTPHWKALWS